jgi:hypothetical protein
VRSGVSNAQAVHTWNASRWGPQAFEAKPARLAPGFTKLVEGEA